MARFEMKPYDDMFMEMARVAGRKSKANKRKVGAIAVKDNNIIGIGINGTPTGWFTNEDIDIDTGSTAEEVLHAEENLIAKVARSSNSSEGATIYVTCAPCIKCARLIAQSGFKRVVYDTPYKDDAGLVMLSILGLDVMNTDGNP
jgi:dCMP deaminase